ncbi:transcriptional regulator [Micractinium conductrix]|uniref:Transcriptional regulator n=1 Tax=Micractinium conductrix TaxID=554055 RepID=A0A2P6VCQ5_9CHLO|nr:transcriptional regulator [Micractinium conductrix]|eukprot:PSC71868.1 transcriptional regulator [Micractinium conductrix]
MPIAEIQVLEGRGYVWDADVAHWLRLECGLVGAMVGGVAELPAPQLMGDWRSFRANLVAQSSGDGGWAVRQAEQNLVLLEIQNPTLAREETWAHATGAPEIGGLLLATSRAPEMVGAEYWQAVVLIVNHGPQGSIGLVLNRPTALKMKRGRGGLPLAVDGMESLREAFAESRIYCGGFNAQQIVTLLHGQRKLEGALEIVPGIFIGGQEAASAEVLTGGLKQTDFRFFMGVCAWQPGELNRLVAEGAFHTAACSRSLVLKQCLQLPTPLWREVMCLMGGQFAEEARAAQRADDGSDDDDMRGAPLPVEMPPAGQADARAMQAAEAARLLEVASQTQPGSVTQQILQLLQRVLGRLDSIEARVESTEVRLTNVPRRASNNRALAGFGLPFTPLVKEHRVAAGGAVVGSEPPAGLFPTDFSAMMQLTGAQLNRLAAFYEEEFSGRTVAERRRAFELFVCH